MTARIRLLHDLLDRQAWACPDGTAVSRDGLRWSYGELTERSRAAAEWLRSMGVERGDRVALLGNNEAAFVPLLFATSRVGAIFVPLSDRLRPYHLAHILADCRPALVVGNDQAVALVRRSVPGQGSGVRVHHLDEVPAPAAAQPAPAGAAPPGSPCLSVDPVCLIYTSGSTAMPKAVVCTHRQVIFAAEAIDGRLGYRADDVVFCCLPISFDYGLYQVFLCCLAGAHLVLGDDADAGPALLGRLVAHDVTVLPLVPSLAATLCRLVRRSGRATRLRMVTNTGAELGPARCAQLRAAVPGLAVVAMYGLTECKRVSIGEADLDLTRPGSVGRPLPDTEVLVVDDQDRPLPAGEVGELVVRGPHVMAGYWNAPDLTALRFRRDELGQPVLHTGDRCRLDADGYLYFVGRDDDVFKQRGYRVSTAEIEAAALDIPGVELAAALPPDGRHGSRLVVCGDITAQGLTEQLRARLEDHKLPSDCRVVRRLPLGLTGKVDRRVLAAWWNRNGGDPGSARAPAGTHARPPAVVEVVP